MFSLRLGLCSARSIRPTPAVARTGLALAKPWKAWFSQLGLFEQRFYITLSMRHFKRGPPLLPVDSQHERVDVRLGEKGTPSCWTRFEGNFQLARTLAQAFAWLLPEPRLLSFFLHTRPRGGPAPLGQEMQSKNGT